jgi:ribose transport system permease protein
VSSPTTQGRPADAATAEEGAQPNAASSGPGPGTRLRSRLSDLAARPLFAVATGLIGLIVIFAVINGVTFVSVDNFRNIALDGSITLVLAVGVTYVLITAGFDLSIGSILVFSGVVAVKAMDAVGGGGWVAALIGLVVALLAGAAWGVLNGSIIAYAGLNPIIVTLGSLGAALGLAQVISGGQDLVSIPDVMINFGIGQVLGVPSPVFVALGTAAFAGIVLAKTRFGRYTYAIGSSQEAATRAGLAVQRHLVVIYTISGTTAGLASWLSLARFSSTNIGGHSLDNLNAATAVLLGGVSLYGGVGTMLGSVFGTFIPAVLANGLVIANVQSYWQQVVTGAVLVLAVYLDRERRKRSA